MTAHQEFMLLICTTYAVLRGAWLVGYAVGSLMGLIANRIDR